MKKQTWKTAIKLVQRKPTSDLPSESSLWKFILQTLLAILTAICTMLGVISCMG